MPRPSHPAANLAFPVPMSALARRHYAAFPQASPAAAAISHAAEPQAAVVAAQSRLVSPSKVSRTLSAVARNPIFHAEEGLVPAAVAAAAEGAALVKDRLAVAQACCAVQHNPPPRLGPSPFQSVQDARWERSLPTQMGPP